MQDVKVVEINLAETKQELNKTTQDVKAVEQNHAENDLELNKNT